MRFLSLAGVVSVAILIAIVPPAADEPPWAEILAPADTDQRTRPAPQDKVVWREDLRAALVEARADDRPVFVTLRCLPCKQCADFDQDVLEGGPRLDPILKQFVTVRLTDARNVDLELLPMAGFQDMDLSWWGWMLSPEGRVYGVFGGKDHVSDATRISVDALRHTLERVLDHHFDARRADWDIDGPAPELTAAARLPADLPGYASWAARGTEESNCLHCHQVVEIMRQPDLDAGRFDKQRDVDVWPLPENVGLVLERDHGLFIERVHAGSAAAATGMRAGDRLAVAGGRRLFGQADFRGVLHRAPHGDATISVRWWRDETLHEGLLELTGAWRDTVLPWRTSISQGNIGAHPGFAWGNAASPADRRSLGIPENTMALRPWFGRKGGGPAWEAGLRGADIVIAVDGESPDVVGRDFMAWFRMRHEPGDRVTLTARRGPGDDRDLSYTLP